MSTEMILANCEIQPAGKQIEAIALTDNSLLLRFTDGTGIEIWDDGQSCCESRYMRTDDTLADFVGTVLLGGEISEAADGIDEDGTVHEVQFLRILTTGGTLTVCTHNEHNGYYGGFDVQVKVVA